jgi:hypothetical protein
VSAPAHHGHGHGADADVERITVTFIEKDGSETVVQVGDEARGSGMYVRFYSTEG